MSNGDIEINHDYEKQLRNSKPVKLKQIITKPPPGALGAVTTIKPQTIPPINTDIRVDQLSIFELNQHPGLSAIDHTKLPENFNWRDDGGEKSKLISEPGNQMLCGSCWAISTAGIIADNHVISETVNWKPKLSITWSLSCFPQLQCKGGNPAKLFQDISKNGLATEHCIDYSWCENNKACNGKAEKHFKKQVNLSKLIPTCGCYDTTNKHYLYYINKPKSISLGKGGLNEQNFTNTIKKHIYYNGPIQGGFLVFSNFRSGAFTKINGGIYLENGVYDKGELKFDDSNTSSSKYVGSHAVAIIGWGIEKNVIVDNDHNKKDIPYWYCRNSWTKNWGDNGYFKMAMYPYNKLSQFDKLVVINTVKGRVMAGGMVLVNVDKPPEKVSLPQLEQKYLKLIKRSKNNNFYKNEHESKDDGDKDENEDDDGKNEDDDEDDDDEDDDEEDDEEDDEDESNDDKKSSITSIILWLIFFIAVIVFIYYMYKYYNKIKKKRNVRISPSATDTSHNAGWIRKAPLE